MRRCLNSTESEDCGTPDDCTLNEDSGLCWPCSDEYEMREVEADDPRAAIRDKIVEEETELQRLARQSGERY